MKRIFICSTPYHVFVCVCILNQLSKHNQKDKNDLVFINDNKEKKNIYELIKKRTMFTNVYETKPVELRKENNLSKVKTIFHYYKEPSKYIDREILYHLDIYDEIYACGHERITDLLNIICHRRNKNINLFLYEEGLLSYLPNGLKSSFLKKSFNFLYGYNYLNYKNKQAYFFQPDLISSHFFSNIIKIKIDKIVKKNLASVFYSQDNYKIEYKYIYLEQPINYTMNSIIRKIILEGLANKIAIKLHPKNSKESNQLQRYEISGKISWEIICLNNDMEEKVFLSFHSTACFIPKLIFNQEPTIVFLYKIKEISGYIGNFKEIDSFIKKFRTLYKKPEKIFIPNTLNEMLNYFKIIEGEK